MAGRFFEDWKVGDRIEHEIRRTVTVTDNLLISTLTHNPQPLHLDRAGKRVRADPRQRHFHLRADGRRLGR
jgi:acyl dehydratase